jgi:hypothetical protein
MAHVIGLSTDDDFSSPAMCLPESPSAVLSSSNAEQMAGWLAAMVHALCLDPAATAAPAAHPPVVGPAACNQCLYCQKEFDFPHKRAALLILAREGGRAMAGTQTPRIVDVANQCALG